MTDSPVPPGMAAVMATICLSLLAKFDERLGERSASRSAWRWVGLAGLGLVCAEAVELARVVERGLVAAAFFGEDVQEDRLVLAS